MNGLLKTVCCHISKGPHIYSNTFRYPKDFLPSFRMFSLPTWYILHLLDDILLFLAIENRPGDHDYLYLNWIDLWSTKSIKILVFYLLLCFITFCFYCTMATLIIRGSMLTKFLIFNPKKSESHDAYTRLISKCSRSHVCHKERSSFPSYFIPRVYALLIYVNVHPILRVYTDDVIVCFKVVAPIFRTTLLHLIATEQCTTFRRAWASA
jgi:hypothetical protein